MIDDDDLRARVDGAEQFEEAQDSEASGDLITINWPDFEGRSAPPRRFIADGSVPRGSVTSLYGGPGIGKSLVAQLLGTCASIGRPWFAYETIRVPVLGIFAEDDDDELWRRQERINAAHGISMRDLTDWHPQGRAGLANVLMTFTMGEVGAPMPLLDHIDRKARELNAGLVILDNVAQLFAGDENRRAEVTQFVNVLAGLARDLDAAVLLLGHPPKNGATYSGSTAWDACVRSRLVLSRLEPEEDQEPELLLARVKSNYAKPDEVRLVWRDGVLRMADPKVTSFGDYIDLEENAAKARRAFLQALDKLTAQGRNISHSERATNYAPKVILASKLGQSFNKRDLAKAMDELLDNGRIEANAKLWSGGDRKPVHGLRRVEPQHYANGSDHDPNEDASPCDVPSQEGEACQDECGTVGS